jgi:hypothetical protein
MAIVKIIMRITFVYSVQIVTVKPQHIKTETRVMEDIVEEYDMLLE